MSTKSPNPALTVALANIPTAFRSRLIDAYVDLKQNCAEARYEGAGLAAGKLCEVTLRLLQQIVHGAFTPFGTKINNYADECRKLITAPTTSGNESERIVLPRALVFLYTMRSKRGIGHVGGDVDANTIDIAAMARISDWIICELIRINHGLSLEEAQDIVDGISVRRLPIIWEVAGKKRVLKEGLEAKGSGIVAFIFKPRLICSYRRPVRMGRVLEPWDVQESSHPKIAQGSLFGIRRRDRIHHSFS